MPRRVTTIYRAAAVRDAMGVDARPGAVAVRDGLIAAAGRPEEVEEALADEPALAHADLPGVLILPALVNAHAHLDLTDLGPQPFGGDFVAWVQAVTQRRPREREAIEQAVRRGLALSREAGVGWVGDIAGSDEAVCARLELARLEEDGGVGGKSYLECFGFGPRESLDLDALRQRLELLRHQTLTVPPERRFGVELGPHAPYSAGRALYAAASFPAHANPCTHLAETPEEERFTRQADGPLADLLRRLGKWSDAIRPTGLSPVAYLRKYLAQARWLVAHCNYVSDEDLAVLAQFKVSVAYCPVASAYFGQPRGSTQGGGHRYRDMLAAGVNVCLGTDSILCQPPAEAQPLGIMAPMRLLHRRDRLEPRLLLEMATTRGLRAMALDPRLATLRAGAPARLMAVPIDPDDPDDPLTQALRNDYPVRRIV